MPQGNLDRKRGQTGEDLMQAAAAERWATDSQAGFHAPGNILGC